MIRFKIPNHDWELVRRLSHRPDGIKSKLWERTSGPIRRFKDDLTALLMVEQQRCCAYCMSYLHEDHPARDHIAPKKEYPAWTFRPDNLVLACYACNTDRKDDYDPIAVRHRKYRRCKFTIVHPYFDRPEAHLDYASDGVKRGILISGITMKGRETIRVFDLMSPARAKQRAADAILADVPNRLQQRFMDLYASVIQARAPLKPAVKIAPTVQD
ncbi:HNH endonuclease [Agrobacterium tumefaciens]|uniref:HNH endonuclease n=1 Tax=Agrobacterium tumefaciens TaxID=358 RepID=UPI002AFF30A9|nr:HNH endonuclease [Agrobacterium tumefaciens]MEA1842971.1 HNH endonuclease [Agrobacterium tumefaciens]